MQSDPFVGTCKYASLGKPWCDCDGYDTLCGLNEKQVEVDDEDLEYSASQLDTHDVIVWNKY